MQFSHTGTELTNEQKNENKRIAPDNLFLQEVAAHEPKDALVFDEQLRLVKPWFYERRAIFYKDKYQSADLRPVFVPI